MKIVDNYEAKIWLGLREGYSDTYSDKENVTIEIQKFCDSISECVTITPTEFIYVNGREPGLVIGFINYARFPKSKAETKKRALLLGKILMEKFEQYRVSITLHPTVPGGSIMLENQTKK